MNLRYLVGVLFAIIFIVSLSYSFYYELQPTTDAAAYDKIGWNVARGLGYIQEEENVSNPIIDDAIVRVGPGYEFFLAGTYFIFDHSIPVIWVFHALFRALSAFFVFLIARELFYFHKNKDVIGIVATILFGFSPDLILINGMLLTETLFITFLTASTYFSLIYIRRPGYFLATATSLLWGYTSLIRPTALAAAFLLSIISFARIKKKYAIVLLLFPLLFVGGWSVRNSMLYETPLFTTTAGSYNLWVGNNKDATGGFDKTPEIVEARAKYHSVELAKISTTKYFEFIKEHPFAFLELQVKKTAKYFSVLRPTGFWSYLSNRPVDQVITIAGSVIWTSVLFVFGFAGAIYLLIKKDVKTRVVLLLAILQPLAVIPLIVETRYRYALFPFLSVFAALSMVTFFKKIDSKRMFNALLLGILIVTSLTAYDVIRNAEEFLTRLSQYT